MSMKNIKVKTCMFLFVHISLFISMLSIFLIGNLSCTTKRIKPAQESQWLEKSLEDDVSIYKARKISQYW